MRGTRQGGIDDLPDLIRSSARIPEVSASSDIVLQQVVAVHPCLHGDLHQTVAPGNQGLTDYLIAVAV